MNPDVSMIIGDTKFNFRVACVVENNGKIRSRYPGNDPGKQH